MLTIKLWRAGGPEPNGQGVQLCVSPTRRSTPAPALFVGLVQLLPITDAP